MRPTITRARALAALAGLAIIVTGCSSTTVEDTDTAASSSLPSATTSTNSDSDSDLGPAKAAPLKTDSDVEDSPVKEISAIPTTTPERTPGDDSYLDALTTAGIDTTGIENQLISTAVEVCNTSAPSEENITLHAVAGQLVEQQRSTETPQVVASHIDKAAREAYCEHP